MMFCPKCKTEYREGFYKCASCGSDLVDGLPQEVPDNVSNVEFVEVFSTYHQDDISFLKSILDGEDITYFFQGENSIMLIAAGAYARLLVKSEDAERAKEILQDLGFLEKT
jgi:hypothetical protein